MVDQFNPAASTQGCLPLAPKPERLQHYETASDGVWVVAKVAIDLLEPDFFMVEMVRREDLGTDLPEAAYIFSQDWPFWLMKHGASLQAEHLQAGRYAGARLPEPASANEA